MVFTSIQFQTSDFLSLLANGNSSTVLNQTRAFPALTTDCAVRSQIFTTAGFAPAHV